jgi:hypothetical protein
LEAFIIILSEFGTLWAFISTKVKSVRPRGNNLRLTGVWSVSLANEEKRGVASAEETGRDVLREFLEKLNPIIIGLAKVQGCNAFASCLMGAERGSF